MSSVDFVVGCQGEAAEMVTDAVEEVFDFLVEPKPVFNFKLCVDVADLTNEFVFITEDGQQIFYTEDGEKFRPDNL